MLICSCLYRIDCQDREATYGRQVGAILACLPRKIIRMLFSPRTQPFRVFQLRAVQNLFPRLQGFVNMMVGYVHKVDEVRDKIEPIIESTHIPPMN